jgi:hypothetical protein
VGGHIGGKSSMKSAETEGGFQKDEIVWLTLECNVEEEEGRQ